MTVTPALLAGIMTRKRWRGETRREAPEEVAAFGQDGLSSGARKIRVNTLFRLLATRDAKREASFIGTDANLPPMFLRVR